MAVRQEVHELLDTDALAVLGQLELISTRIVEGFVSGKHRSPYKGGCIEFAEHRDYSPGDEVRLLDWKAFARSDRYYIKQFEEETNLQVHVILDASGSMAFGESTQSKFRYAQQAAACMSRLLLHQRDAVGLAVIDTKVRSFIPPRSRANHFQVLLQELARAKPGGETSLAGNLQDLAKRIKRRGLIILISDCFDEVESLIRALHLMASRGNETMLFHVMAPEELTFSFNKWSRFESLEADGERVDLDPASIRKSYLERVHVFLDRLREGCGEYACEYVPLSTDQPLGDALAYYLARRAARIKA